MLIIGKSGSGKSTSMRNCTDNPDWGLVNVLGKSLPFKGRIPGAETTEYPKIKGIIKSCKAKSVVLDDVGYLMTDCFMQNHSSKGKGDAVFGLYNTIGDNFYNLVRFVSNPEWVQKDKIVYFMMHEELDNFGNTKPKTIGKMLDEKVCLEGMFSIVLRATISNGKHVFETQSDGFSVAKTPMGMFDEITIDNDLLAVDKIIREYYELSSKEESNGTN